MGYDALTESYIRWKDVTSESIKILDHIQRIAINGGTQEIYVLFNRTLAVFHYEKNTIRVFTPYESGALLKFRDDIFFISSNPDQFGVLKHLKDHEFIDKTIQRRRSKV